MGSSAGEQVKDNPAPCETCGNNGAWHRENKPQHPYEPEQPVEKPARGRDAADPLEGRADRPQQGQARQTPAAYRQRPFPTDPALRMILVDKGIISASELDQADQMLLSLMGLGAVGRPPMGGQSEFRHSH